MKKVHFIAIGGSAMHNIAIALHKKGYTVTGSDDEILEPSRTKLAQCHLLPADDKWHPEKISVDIDAVILGMHAKDDNPELVRAKELKLKIMSYPEFILEQSRDKVRIVIGGSHGKTTITSMIIHTLIFNNIETDFLVGAQLEGFDNMVRLSDTAKYIVIEGDEYLASALDPRPKFLIYNAFIGLISGIAWDHVNVFPSFYIYIDQFRKFINSIESMGTLIYCENDIMVKRLVDESKTPLTKVPYSTHPFEIFDNRNFLKVDSGRIPLYVFGEHNMQNIAGAKAVCEQLDDMTNEMFYNAMLTFKGASKRLQLISKTDTVNVYLDFAHSPSKVTATLKAVRQQFPQRHLVACMELYSQSSLSENFLDQYNGSMDLADERYVYYNPSLLEQKGLKKITPEQVFNAFGNNTLKVFTNLDELLNEIYSLNWHNRNLLFMSSGNFSGLNLHEVAEKITNIIDLQIDT
jgi:UDP-N-acetylmuramate: L-alanyl-gamma-D-glutamyl-meso-diaminopimelate ligase